MKEGKKTGAARTQIATRDEEWSDERLKTFLELQPPEGMPERSSDAHPTTLHRESQKMALPNLPVAHGAQTSP